MKTIAIFSNPIDAHLLISLLEGNGVRAFARDDYVVSNEMGATHALGGVKVDVAAEDYEKALAIRYAPIIEEKAF
jgi:hypothetical protein